MRSRQDIDFQSFMSHSLTKVGVGVVLNGDGTGFNPSLWWICSFFITFHRWGGLKSGRIVLGCRDWTLFILPFFW